MERDPIEAILAVPCEIHAALPGAECYRRLVGNVTYRSVFVCLPRIRAALSPEAPKPNTCCYGFDGVHSDDCEGENPAELPTAYTEPVPLTVGGREARVAEAATCASWCGTYAWDLIHGRVAIHLCSGFGEGGEAHRCWCSKSCRDASRPLHPATEQAETPRQRHVGPKNFAGSCGACMRPWDEPPMYPPCESPFNRAEQEGGNR